MKRFLVSLVICLGLIVSVSNNAMSQTKIGIGVSLNPTALIGNDGEMFFLPASMMNIYLPIQIGKTFRIEPEVGFYSQTSDITDNDNKGRVRTNSFTRFGIGGFYTLQPAKNFQMYFGPRIGVLMTYSERDYANSEYNTDSETSQTIITIGGSFGGEYFLSDYFSLGLEVQLNYFNYGEPVEKPDDYAPKDYSQSIFTTNGLIFARLYFNK
ncbi:outer membrane beta-barrel protein [Bacteroidota bacterium]